MLIRLFLISLFLCFVPWVRAAELPGIPQFIDEMVAKHKFKRAYLENVFKRAEHRQSIIDAISKPATLKPWPEYRASFINGERVSRGLTFWNRYIKALRRAERKYGVPQEIIVALIGVETMYGRNAGKNGTLDTLTTLAFDYPRRADFFRGELEQLLLLAREQKFELFKLQGSYAGALGIPQFMPGSYRKYAVDFNGDGKIDLQHNPVDAIGSVANYLNKYGWIKGGVVTVRTTVSEDSFVGKLAQTHTVAEWAASGVKADSEVAEGTQSRLMDFTLADSKEFWLAFANFDVITRYNNSDFYAMTVFQLAAALRAAHHLT